MKYMMLIFDTEVTATLDEAGQQAWGAEVMAWYEKHGGSSVLPDTGAQLQPAETARTVRSSGVTDGPFIESKEVLGGYSILETESYDEAVEIAQGWPGVDRGLVTLELRPVVQF